MVSKRTSEPDPIIDASSSQTIHRYAFGDTSELDAISLIKFKDDESATQVEAIQVTFRGDYGTTDDLAAQVCSALCRKFGPTKRSTLTNIKADKTLSQPQSWVRCLIH